MVTHSGLDFRVLLTLRKILTACKILSDASIPNALELVVTPTLTGVLRRNLLVQHFQLYPEGVAEVLQLSRVLLDTRLNLVLFT